MFSGTEHVTRKLATTSQLKISLIIALHVPNTTSKTRNAMEIHAQYFNFNFLLRYAWVGGDTTSDPKRFRGKNVNLESSGWLNGS